MFPERVSRLQFLKLDLLSSTIYVLYSLLLV
jgi:hypothetical protein